jgi:hypothetical protein
MAAPDRGRWVKSIRFRSVSQIEEVTNMKKRAIRQAIVWGGLLILSGVVLVLAQLANPSIWTWVAIFAGGGLGAFIVYLTEPADVGLLVPPYILWAVAGMGVLLELEMLDNGYEATYIFGALALPFLVASLRRRSNRWLLLVVFALAVLAIMVPLIVAEVLSDELIASYLFGAGALAFVVAWFTGRAGTWTLWVAYVLGALAVLFPLSEGERVADHVVGTYLMAAGALPFLLHSLIHRRWGWRVFMGYGLLAIAVLIPLVEEGVIGERYTAAYLLLATALGFVLEYARKRGAWWPLVPAGIAAVAGTSLAIRQDAVTYLGAAVLVIAGLAVIARQVTRPEMGGQAGTPASVERF